MLYRWPSEALKNYARGDLIAAADNADEARRLIRDAFAEWAKEMRPHIFRPNGELWDDDAAEDWEKLKATLESDLSADPEISWTALIGGSE